MHKLIRRYASGRIARREVLRVTGNRQASVLRSFARSFGDRDPKNMSKADVERWLATRSHLAAGTRRYEVATLRQFTKWLQIEGVLRRDPMLQIKNPTVPRRVPRALTQDHDRAIEAVLPDARARAIYALMRWCGLRRCEVLRLEVGDWDRSVGLLHVTGKGSHEREVPVTERAEMWLAAYLAETRCTAGPFIRRLDGTGPISNCYLGILMRQWMEDAGVKQRAGDGKACHSLRHTLASNVADVEDDLRVTQQMLGHASLTSTEMYLRRAKLKKIRAAMESAA